MAQHLTDALIRKLEPPEKGNSITYDAAVPGFGVRVTAAGHRAFILNYRVRDTGRERRYTIGRFPDRTTVMARERARELRREVEDGGDPVGALQDSRDAPTVADLIERFRAEHLPKKREGTRKGYDQILKKHIEPFFGSKKKVADVTTEDIDGLHGKIGAPYTANRTVAVLSKMFNLAVRWRMRTDTPVKNVELNDEHPRQRYLTGPEMERLFEAMAAHPERQSVNILRVLMLTGARKGEVLAMRWADVDLTEGKWSKPAASTKQNKPHEVVLSGPVRQLLAEIADEQTGKGRRPLPTFVFPSAVSETGHVADIYCTWWALCKSAKIDGLRIHDLRHSFASHLASGGASLPLIGAMLGHTKTQTTARYAHLFDEPQRAAAERVAAIYEAVGKPAVEPVLLKRRGR